MKVRFLLFAGENYYPGGGANDFKGSYENFADAILAHNPREFTYDGGWANILDLSNNSIIANYYEDDWHDRL